MKYNTIIGKRPDGIHVPSAIYTFAGTRERSGNKGPYIPARLDTLRPDIDLLINKMPKGYRTFVVL